MCKLVFGLITEIFTRFLINFVLHCEVFLDAFFLCLMLGGGGGWGTKKQEKTHNRSYFPFFAFFLQETHEIVAIKKFKDSEGNLCCCIIFHVNNYIVNISPVKIRSLIYQGLILK